MPRSRRIVTRHGAVGEDGSLCVLTGSNETNRPRRAIVRVVDTGLCPSHTAVATLLVDGEPRAVRVDLREHPQIETEVAPLGHVVLAVHLELLNADTCVRFGNLGFALDVA